MTRLALGGFLGRPDDWDGVLDSCWERLDWMRDLPSAESEYWLGDLARRVGSATDADVLLGYSMGGRIALHILIQNPDRWRAAIIVSASPGPKPGEDPARASRDEAWAERFRSEPWESVLADWNAQSVFAHDPPDRLSRTEDLYDRAQLAEVLTHCSVARQADLRDALRQLTVPVLWVAGERDTKYSALAAECAALNSQFSLAIVPEAGHRAPWGNPTAFTSAIDAFLLQHSPQ